MSYTIGLKYTHDGGVSVIKNGTLALSSEVEKIHNSDRYSKIKSISEIESIISKCGFDLSFMLRQDTKIIVDGWRDDQDTDCEIGKIKDWGIDVSGYRSHRTFSGPESSATFNKKYKSYSHAYGHLIGSYVSSSFSKHREPSYAILWDGGNLMDLYLISPEKGVEFVKNIEPLSGLMYGVMGYYYGPYKMQEVIDGRVKNSYENKLYGRFHVPGKLMSYIGFGEENKLIEEIINGIYTDILSKNDPSKMYRGDFEHKIMREIVGHKVINNFSDATILLSIHNFLKTLMVDGATNAIPKNSNLIFTGGSALNIKWNSALRNTGHFKNVWVPPFPNDSGSSIGSASCEMAFSNNIWSLNWSVYSGPQFVIDVNLNDIKHSKVDPESLGKFIFHNTDSPVLVLHGRAEIGPRALGHRSFMMHPGSLRAKYILNKIKNREDFRPVAPICLEEDSQKFFSPGTSDKYMLFEHIVKENKKDIIPAVVHVDGTSRLQTIDQEDCETTYKILKGFKEKSGFGILCNTSANFNGFGFLPDLSSAIRFAKENNVKYIWANGIMVEVSK